MQLSPAGTRRKGQGRDPSCRWHADGAQHDRDLGRDHDGHRGDAGVACESRGDRGFDRAGVRRASVRCGDRDQRLRQDDPWHRDGALPAERAKSDAVWRLDLPGPLPWRAGDDPGGFRGGRRARFRPDRRRGADRARGSGVAGCRSMRRPVHGEHDGDGVRGAGDLAGGLLDGPGDASAEDQRSLPMPAGS